MFVSDHLGWVPERARKPSALCFYSPPRPGATPLLGPQRGFPGWVVSPLKVRSDSGISGSVHDAGAGPGSQAPGAGRTAPPHTCTLESRGTTTLIFRHLFPCK